MKLSNDVTDSPRFTCFSDNVLPSVLLISTFSNPDCTMNTLSSTSPSTRNVNKIFRQKLRKVTQRAHLPILNSNSFVFSVMISVYLHNFKKIGFSKWPNMRMPCNMQNASGGTLSTPSAVSSRYSSGGSTVFNCIGNVSSRRKYRIRFANRITARRFRPWPLYAWPDNVFTLRSIRRP